MMTSDSKFRRWSGVGLDVVQGGNQARRSFVYLLCGMYSVYKRVRYSIEDKICYDRYTRRRW